MNSFAEFALTSAGSNRDKARFIGPGSRKAMDAACDIVKVTHILAPRAPLPPQCHPNANSGDGRNRTPLPSSPKKTQGLTAIAPISTATSRGRRATCTVARAGATPVK